MLSDEQKMHFEVFGFLVLRQLFDAEEAATIRREAYEVFLEQRDGLPFDGLERQTVKNVCAMRPFMDSVVDDDRIHGIACDLLGEDYILDGSEGHTFAEDSKMHGGDDRFCILRNIKIAFYLEPLTADSGCLRIIPGSHMPPFVDMLKPLKKQYFDQSYHPFGVSGPELPSCAIETEPGDALVFPEEIFHGAFNGAVGRTQLAVNFAANPVSEKQIEFVRGLYGRPGHTSFIPPRAYVNSNRPRLRNMVSRLCELGFNPE